MLGGVDGIGHGHTQLIVQARTARTAAAAMDRAASVRSRCRRMWTGMGGTAFLSEWTGYVKDSSHKIGAVTAYLFAAAVSGSVLV